MRQVAKKFNLSFIILQRYICEKEKQMPLGPQLGRITLLSVVKSECFCQVAIHTDRGNDGETVSELIAHVRPLKTELSEDQCRNHYYKTFLKNHKGRIKPRAVKAHNTSTQCSQCTVAQQFCRYSLYKNALDFCHPK